MPQRLLSEPEYNAIKTQVLQSAPDNLSESDFSRFIGPAMEQALGTAENLPATPQGSALGRVASGVWQNLNPMGLLNAIRHPIDAVTGAVAAQGAQFGKAADDYRQGHYSEMLGHAAAGAIPLVGPAAANAGESIGSGDIAGGLGQAAGLLAPFGVDAALTYGPKAINAIAPNAATNVANKLDQSAVRTLVDVTAPKVGPNKTRLNNQMAKVAPQILRDPALNAFSREGLATKVEGQLTNAEAALDAAAEARGNTGALDTGPIRQALEAKRGELVAPAVEGSRMIPAVTGEAVRDVPINPMRQYALQWMKDEMETFPFTKHTWTDAPKKGGNAAGGSMDLVPGSAGAPIYREIIGQSGELSKASRADVLKAINKMIDGQPVKGGLNDLINGVADDLVQGGKAQDAMLTPGPLAIVGGPRSRFVDLKSGKPTDAPAMAGRPIGQDVVPTPNAPRVGPIDQALQELDALGPVARYESVRRMRQAYDQPAKAVYAPSITADYLAKRGEQMGAADVAGVLRKAMAEFDPASAEANATYHVYRTAGDVLKATQETEQARPRVGRGIMARATGAMVGAHQGGVLGAGIGATVASVIDHAAQAAPTLRIVWARRLAGLADALRRGDTQGAGEIANRLKASVPAAGVSAASQVSQAAEREPYQNSQAASR